MSDIHPTGLRTGTKLLTLDKVSSGYGPVTIVHELSLAIAQSEIFALLGKNGMGKTTLLKAIMGLIPLREGAIRFTDTDISHATTVDRIAGGMSYAPQEVPLFQDLNIRDNLRLALHSDREFAEASDRTFSYFPFLKDRLSQKAGTLSGGEQKMLILTRALMRKPKLLLVDEISEGLQPSVVDRIADVLRREREASGTTIVVVEQNLDFILKVADRWAVLKLGRLDDTGPVNKYAKARILEHLKI